MCLEAQSISSLKVANIFKTICICICIHTERIDVVCIFTVCVNYIYIIYISTYYVICTYESHYWFFPYISFALNKSSGHLHLTCLSVCHIFSLHLLLGNPSLSSHTQINLLISTHCYQGDESVFILNLSCWCLSYGSYYFRVPHKTCIWCFVMPSEYSFFATFRISLNADQTSPQWQQNYRIFGL